MPFNCTQCNFSCKQASNLNMHTQTHSGGKPFSCVQCNYSCSRAGHLQTHLQTHSEEKLFGCTQCNFSCTRAYTLGRHMLTHSGEKPFICTQCTIPSQQQGVWSNTCSYIQERSFSGVRSVPFLLLLLVISRSTSSCIMENSPLNVNSADILAVTPRIWSITCFCTPARNLLHVSNATTPAKCQNELKRHMWKHSSKTEA